MSRYDSHSNFGDDDRTVIRPSPGGHRQRMPSISPADSRVSPSPDMVLQEGRLQGSNPLAESAFSLLSLVPKLRNLPAYHAIDELQVRLVDEIRKFENSALQQGASQKQVNIASYFLCSLIDETILNTPWGSQSNWGHHSLLVQFHNEAWGGENFFPILERLKQQPMQNLNPLELAYLCLSLGFEGKYRIMDDGLRALDQLHQEIYLLIQRIRGDSERSLSIRWRGLRGLRSPLGEHLPLWVIAAVAGTLLLLIYSGFLYAITGVSNRVGGKLSNLAQNVDKSRFRPQPKPITLTEVDRFRRLLAGEIARNMVVVIDGSILRISKAFPSGSAKVKNEYLPMLTKIAREFQNDASRIMVIGHTDNLKIKFSLRFPSNWELSVARAKNVANLLTSYGVSGDRVRFEGRADIDPIVPNNSKANRARNRRVDIHIR